MAQDHHPQCLPGYVGWGLELGVQLREGVELKEGQGQGVGLHRALYYGPQCLLGYMGVGPRGGGGAKGGGAEE